MSSLLTIVCTLSYPLLVHLAIIRSEPVLLLLAIILLIFGLLLFRLKAGAIDAWLIFIAVLISAGVTYHFSLLLYVSFAPPVVLPLLLFYIFGRTLLRGETPLVTRIGQEARGPLGSPLERYTRRVTQLWTCFFLFSAVFSLCLAIFASAYLWSIYTNFISYILTAILFAGEFVWRKTKFQQHDHPSFIDYVKIVVRSQMKKRDEYQH